jgi:hypothetical protein
MERPFLANCPLSLISANIPIGINVNDHTTYPNVAGNPAFSGISIGNFRSRVQNTEMGKFKQVDLPTFYYSC